MPATLPSLEFGPDRIKRIRVSLGLSQAAFSERLGVSKAVISYWETGKYPPKAGRTLKALLDAEAEVTSAVN